ncbi:MAG: LPS-assembly protein LptD [Aquamicrobium sp.]|uniref:LPS-assembly protein LptD n=1 Tax=Aquamicrobium sp. TaxID=1872579 RepID=UPI00349EFD2E|nr:LPS-assembly protein LptD [Aquamicrobium sp.]
MRARIACLAGATALACALVGAALPGVAAAQAIDLDRADISPDAELLLEADTLVYDNDRNTITAEGGVRIDYDGHRLVARRIVYDRATARLIASGDVEIVDRQGTRIHTDEIDITDDFRDAFVRTLRVETVDKAYFAADSAEREGGEVTTFNYGVYTACEPCREKPDKAPAWRVKAQKIIWHGKEKTVRFENARFELFGLPIAYLPYFEMPDPTVKQKSGFLIPSVSKSDELGYGVKVPYYWALSPTYDVTFRPAWYSKQGFLGHAEWRQRFNNGGYSVTIAGIRQNRPGEFDPNTVDRERTRGMIGSKGAFRINPRWTFGWDVMVQTDKNFANRYDIEGYGKFRRTNEIYLTGLNDRNYFDLRFQKFNVQEAHVDFDPLGRDRDRKQPWVLPTLDYSYTPDAPIAGGELNIDVNLRSLHRGMLDAPTYIGSINPQTAVRGIDGSSTRLTAEAEWKRSFITPGGLMLTPILHARADAISVDYEGGSAAAINNFAALNGVSADMRSSYTRATATAGLEARWPFLFATANSSHVVEPMAQVFARPDAPHGDTVGIPNEDAQSMVFDATNLFERDKFSGYDRIEGGVRANLGLRYSGSFANGWSTNALFGQSFHLAGENPYASPDLVHVGAASGLETDRSDYVGMVGLASPTGLSLAAGARFDEDTFDVRRTDVSAAYTSRPVTVSGVYSFIEAQPDYGFDEDRREVRGNASVRIHDNWRVFGGGSYDLTHDVMTRRSIGFAYDDDCFAFAISMSETEHPTTHDKSRNFGFMVSLRTIGEFGNTNTAF